MRAKIPQSARDGQQPCQIAALLNQLFATRLSPEGHPYTLAEVAKATGMSVPYLSILRKGTIRAVSFQRVVALARFFGVPLRYFSPEVPPVEPLADAVREALAQPLVPEFAVWVGRLSLAQRALVLQLLEHIDHLQGEPAQVHPACPNYV